MIYQTFDIFMSISTWDKVYFWIYLLNHNSLSHQNWLIDKSALQINIIPLPVTMKIKTKKPLVKLNFRQMQ